MLKDLKGTDTVKAARIEQPVLTSEFWTYMWGAQHLLSTQKAQKDILAQMKNKI